MASIWWQFNKTSSTSSWGHPGREGKEKTIVNFLLKYDTYTKKCVCPKHTAWELEHSRGQHPDQPGTPGTASWAPSSSCFSPREPLSSLLTAEISASFSHLIQMESNPMSTLCAPRWLLSLRVCLWGSSTLFCVVPVFRFHGCMVSLCMDTPPFV